MPASLGKWSGTYMLKGKGRDSGRHPMSGPGRSQASSAEMAYILRNAVQGSMPGFKDDHTFS